MKELTSIYFFFFTVLHDFQVLFRAVMLHTCNLFFHLFFFLAFISLISVLSYLSNGIFTEIDVNVGNPKVNMVSVIKVRGFGYEGEGK